MLSGRRRAVSLCGLVSGSRSRFGSELHEKKSIRIPPEFRNQSHLSYRLSVFPDDFTLIYKKTKSSADFKKSYDNLKLDIEKF